MYGTRYIFCICIFSPEQQFWNKTGVPTFDKNGKEEHQYNKTLVLRICFSGRLLVSSYLVICMKDESFGNLHRRLSDQFSIENDGNIMCSSTTLTLLFFRYYVRGVLFLSWFRTSWNCQNVKTLILMHAFISLKQKLYIS